MPFLTQRASSSLLDVQLQTKYTNCLMILGVTGKLSESGASSPRLGERERKTGNKRREFGEGEEN